MLTLILPFLARLHHFLLASLWTDAPGSSPPPVTREARSSSLSGSQLPGKALTRSPPPGDIHLCQQNTTGKFEGDDTPQISDREHMTKYKQCNEPRRMWSSPLQGLKRQQRPALHSGHHHRQRWAYPVRKRDSPGNAQRIIWLVNIFWWGDYKEKEAYVNARSCSQIFWQ